MVALLLFGVVAASLVALDRRPLDAGAPDLAAPPPALQPVVRGGDLLTDSWFCPGVPAAADGTAGGSVSITNQGSTALAGTLTYLPSEGNRLQVPVSVPPLARLDVDVAAVVKAPFVAVAVELAGGGAFVEQTVTGRSGIGISSCTSDPSPTWYLADGATTVDAGYRILLSNPFPDDAIVDMSFATDEGPREPQALQGYVVPAGGLKVIKVDDHVRRNTLVSASIVARTGRVVVGRYQGYAILPRRGIVSGLGSPAAGSEWWFANGEKSEGINERVVVYNPGEADVDVAISLYPLDPEGAVPIEPLEVTLAGGASSVVDLTASEVVPEGRHSIRVSSGGGEPIVVERIMDLASDARRTTTVQPGSLMQSSQWVMSAAAPGGSTTTLAVVNPLATDTTLRVLVLGADGFRPAVGFESLKLPGAGSLRIEAPGGGVPLMVAADGPVVVERMLVPAGGQAGAASAYALPVVAGNGASEGAT
ncbi:MAG TPA: DUF5719 family protein [Acidimicrobiales bacterium]